MSHNARTEPNLQSGPNAPSDDSLLTDAQIEAVQNHFRPKAPALRERVAMAVLGAMESMAFLGGIAAFVAGVVAAAEASVWAGAAIIVAAAVGGISRYHEHCTERLKLFNGALPAAFGAVATTHLVVSKLKQKDGEKE